MATFYVDGITYTIIILTNVSVTSSISGISRTNLVLDFVTNPATGIVYTITEIGTSAFNSRPGLTGTLTIGNAVKTIGNYAFFGCGGLTGTLTIGDAVTNLGDGAFYGCEGFNGNLTIGGGVTQIAQGVFQNCHGLTGTLTISAGVTAIGGYAFAGCSSLAALVIGNSVTTIGNYAFQNCSSLSGSLTIVDAVTTIGDGAFYGCEGLNGTLTIGAGVTAMGDRVFEYCLLLSNYIFLGNAPTTFGTNMFDTGPTPEATITYTLGTSGWPASAPYLWPPAPYTGTQLVATGVGSSVCVLKDTPICVGGVKMYKKIQDLREGDSIIGAVSNTPKKIKQVVITSHKYTDIDPNNVPYKIPADFYAKNIPVQDIYISGTHAIAFSNRKKETILISVIYADKFVPATVDELAAFGYPEITYYNIELDEPDGMYAGGVPVETLGLRKSLNL